MFGWFDEYGIWDATAFGCSMNTLVGIKTSKYKDGNPIIYIFASCQYAERAVYPFLDEEKIGICRKNVDAFYKNPNIQAAWHDFILHPVCLKVTKEMSDVIPVVIESIGCGQGAMGRYKFAPIVSIDDKENIEYLRMKD